MLKGHNCSEMVRLLFQNGGGVQVDRAQRGGTIDPDIKMTLLGFHSLEESLICASSALDSEFMEDCRLTRSNWLLRFARHTAKIV
jgi:hypothetical protein